MDSSFDLVTGLRWETVDFAGYGIAISISSGEAVNHLIGLARTVGIIEDQARRGDGRLEFNFSRTVRSKELQPGQPPERRS